MYRETIAILEKFSDPGEFERLGCDLLSRLNYRGIEPQGVGAKDGGKDALHFADDGTTVIHFSLRKDWKKKIIEDLEITKKHGGHYKKFVFVSNRKLPPLQKDKIKDLILSDYGWEASIYGQEFLRSELDTHSLDLREKYLGIPKSQINKTEELIEYFSKLRDEKSNYVTHTWFVRLLMLAVPYSIRNDRMKLFDSKEKFIGNTEKLKSVLGSNLPDENFKSKVTSNSFSTSTIMKESFSYLNSIPAKYIFEANLYDTGIIEILHDVTFLSLDEYIDSFVVNFFSTIKELYKSYFGENEYVTLRLSFLNARRMRLKKDDGKTYCGEKHYFDHEAGAELKVILTEKFQMEFLEILKNKLMNFFNVAN